MIHLDDRSASLLDILNPESDGKSYLKELALSQSKIDSVYNVIEKIKNGSLKRSGCFKKVVAARDFLKKVDELTKELQKSVNYNLEIGFKYTSRRLVRIFCIAQKIINTDPETAEKLLEIASNEDHPGAMFQLGKLRFDRVVKGSGDNKDFLELFKKAANLGEKHAQHTYAMILLVQGGRYNTEKAAQYFKKSISQGCIESVHELEKLYTSGVIKRLPGESSAGDLLKIFEAEKKKEAEFEQLLKYTINSEGSDQDTCRKAFIVIQKSAENGVGKAAEIMKTMKDIGLTEEDIGSAQFVTFLSSWMRAMPNQESSSKGEISDREQVSTSSSRAQSEKQGVVFEELYSKFSKGVEGQKKAFDDLYNTSKEEVFKLKEFIINEIQARDIVCTFQEEFSAQKELKEVELKNVAEKVKEIFSVRTKYFDEFQGCLTKWNELTSGSSNSFTKTKKKKISSYITDSSLISSLEEIREDLDKHTKKALEDLKSIESLSKKRWSKISDIQVRFKKQQQNLKRSKTYLNAEKLNNRLDELRKSALEIKQKTVKAIEKKEQEDKKGLVNVIHEVVNAKNSEEIRGVHQRYISKLNEPKAEFFRELEASLKSAQLNRDLAPLFSTAQDNSLSVDKGEIHSLNRSSQDSKMKTLIEKQKLEIQQLKEKLESAKEKRKIIKQRHGEEVLQLNDHIEDLKKKMPVVTLEEMTVNSETIVNLYEETKGCCNSKNAEILERASKLFYEVIAAKRSGTQSKMQQFLEKLGFTSRQGKGRHVQCFYQVGSRTLEGTFMTFCSHTPNTEIKPENFVDSLDALAVLLRHMKKSAKGESSSSMESR